MYIIIFYVSIILNVLLIFMCISYSYKYNNLKYKSIEMETDYSTTTTNLSKQIEDLENNIKDLKVEKYRSYDNVIDLYKRNDDLRDKISLLEIIINKEKLTNERLRSLRQRKNNKSY